jgi:hypothetical protein
MEGRFVAGADPELMLVTPEGRFTSAIPLLEGTKAVPQPVAGGAVQRDNVMAEFNVQPSGCSEEFTDNVRVVMGELAKLVRPNRLTTRAYARFPKSELEHPEAKVFGCDPDFCAWPNADGALYMNTVPAHLAMEPYRSAGGHFHVGHKPDTKEMLEDDFGKIEVVRMMDIFMGVPSVLMDPDRSSKSRRSLYGTAGAHRPKPYGVEYRALGNFWLGSPDLVQLMYELADRAVELTLQGESVAITEQIGQPTVEDTINNSKKAKARSVLTKVLQKYLPHETYERLRSNSPITAIQGKDLYQTWGLA